MNDLCVGILLAAGNSHRFGSSKLLHQIDNTPMLLMSAQVLANAVPNSIAVINQALLPYADQLAMLGLKVIVNTRAGDGIGSSIACGVRASAHAAGWLIALADMPFIQQETIRCIHARLEAGAEIVAPVYHNQRGHPVGFHSRYKAQLIGLHDDIGARNIIAHHQSRLELVPTNDAGVIRDIDLPSDIPAY